MLSADQPSFLRGPNGRLAFRRRDGAGPGLVWFGGFAADMTGTKAAFLAGWTKAEGRAFLRFDYSGHGQSEGRFEDGCISDWTADALAVFDGETEGPQILIGSSMGAWIASLLALKRPGRVAGMIFIAPAPDFTEALIWNSMDEETRAQLMADGRIIEPSPDGGVTFITRKLIEDGRRNLILGGPIAIACPVRILHGMKDADVPYAHAIRFAEAIASTDVQLTLVKDGDHRLSGPRDLERLKAAVRAALERN